MVPRNVTLTLYNGQEILVESVHELGASDQLLGWYAGLITGIEPPVKGLNLGDWISFRSLTRTWLSDDNRKEGIAVRMISEYSTDRLLFGEYLNKAEITW